MTYVGEMDVKWTETPLFGDGARGQFELRSSPDSTRPFHDRARMGATTKGAAEIRRSPVGTPNSNSFIIGGRSSTEFISRRSSTQETRWNFFRISFGLSKNFP